MPQSPVTADIHQTLDACLHLAARRTFHLEILGDDVTDACNFIVIPTADALVEIDFRLLKNGLRRRIADAVYIRQRDNTAFVFGEINSGYTCHFSIPLKNLFYSVTQYDIRAGYYPWRCLCFGFLQITRTFPLRRMILQ
jgi:hypothetical protein